ncbi:MAG: uridine kinase [Oscillospiraceae bacterium]|jgi:uridine kinase|nr:uridine kinase [Oscillospiraceae bacterium]
MSNIIVLGIAGGSGSGKTTLMKNLIARFKDDVTVISHDNYYRPYDNLTIEERKKMNYDHPDAFDTEMMIEHLAQLKSGQTVYSPIYDFTTYSRREETERLEPKKVILVEGILIYQNKALCKQMDIKIFVDTDADVRLIRRIRRDVSKRGRSLDSVLSQYLGTVKPMHEQFVEPSKKNADLVVLEGGKNLVALDMIIGRIEKQIAKTGDVAAL